MKTSENMWKVKQLWAIKFIEMRLSYFESNFFIQGFFKNFLEFILMCFWS